MPTSVGSSTAQIASSTSNSSMMIANDCCETFVMPQPHPNELRVPHETLSAVPPADGVSLLLGTRAMSTIINVRGTNGSGKSSTVKAVMQRLGGMTPIYRPHAQGSVNYNTPKASQIEAYVCKDRFGVAGGGMIPAYLIGPYVTECGGCDQIKTQDEVCDLVRKYAEQGHVLFEGVIVSQIFQRYIDLATELRALGHRYIFAQMNTPLSVCLERIYGRRLAKGQDGTIKEELVVEKFKRTTAHFEKIQATGHEVVWLDHQYPMDHVYKLLMGKQT